MATEINAGRVAMVPKGEWDATTAYTRLDVVQHGGSAWVCIQDGTGQEPASGSTYWQLLAAGIKATDYYTKTQVDTALQDKQDALVSGQNIKSINGQSVLGTGNLELGELFVVTMTQNNSVYTADKSVSEIYAASYTNGKPVIAVMRDINNPVFILTDCDPDGDSYVFSAIESNVVTTLRWQQTDDYTYELETIALQPHLVSGTNIKTVNNESLLGSGNVTIAGGEDGKSAYQSYVDTTTDSPVKTEAQWIASLKGEQGEKGDKGDTGATGATGATGPKGDNGVGFASASSPTTADGTWQITLTNGDTITIDLNHVHPQYLEYELVQSLPASPDSGTLYLIAAE